MITALAILALCLAVLVLWLCIHLAERNRDNAALVIQRDDVTREADWLRNEHGWPTRATMPLLPMVAMEDAARRVA